MLNFYVFCSVEYSACVSGFLGHRPQTPTGALPLHPAGGHSSPRPPLLSPVANSWLRPCILSQHSFKTSNVKESTVSQVLHVSQLLQLFSSRTTSVTATQYCENYIKTGSPSQKDKSRKNMAQRLAVRNILRALDCNIKPPILV